MTPPTSQSHLQHALIVEMVRGDDGELEPWTLRCSTCGLPGLGLHGARHLAYFASDQNRQAIEAAGVHSLDEVDLLTPVGLAELAVRHVAGEREEESAFPSSLIEASEMLHALGNSVGALQMLLEARTDCSVEVFDPT